MFGVVGFNRTFMELKLEGAAPLLSLVDSFNRTFMELKLCQTTMKNVRNKMFQSYLYGIEIGQACEVGKLGVSFNRTFMELK